LLSRYSDLVWSVCRRILFREQDAQDGFQVTFLTLFRRGDQIHSEVFGPWIRRVAYHAALQIRDQRIQEGMNEEFSVDQIADAEDAFERIEKVERNLTLEQALHSLPEHLYELTVQFHLEGRTRAEIANHCQISEGKVKSRLQQARQKLREHLTRKGLGAGALLMILGLPEFARAAPPESLIEKTVFNLNAIYNPHGIDSVWQQSTLLERNLFMTSKTLGLAKGAGAAIFTIIVVSLLSVFLNPNNPSAALPTQTVGSNPNAKQGSPEQFATFSSNVPLSQQGNVPVSTHVAADPLRQDLPVKTETSTEFGKSKESEDSDIAGLWSSRSARLEIRPSSNLLKVSMNKVGGIPFGITAVGEYRRIGDLLVGVIVSCQMDTEQTWEGDELETVLAMKAMLDSLSDQPFMVKVKSMDSSIYVRDIRIGFPPEMMEFLDGPLVPQLKAFLTGEFKKDRNSKGIEGNGYRSRY
jgi:RNA polymerase sigma factor (sigma-70 family)